MKNKLLKTIVMLSRYFLFGFVLQLLFLNLGLAINVNGQYKSIEEVRVRLPNGELTLHRFFREVQRQTPFRFSYDSKVVERSAILVFEGTDSTVEDYLKEVSRQSSLSFRQLNNTIDVLQKSPVEVISVIDVDPVTVTGTVTDANGDPLPGVTVIIEGTSTGTITDVDGEYSIDAEEGAVLVYSFVGFVNQRRTIGTSDTINVQLMEDSKSLDEVVVVGYGTQKKSDITGAVVSLSEDDFNRGINTSVDQLIQGRAPGVQITQTSGEPGAGVAVRIRGTTSLNSSNQPLYVIDGLPINNSTAIPSSGADIPSNTSPRNPLNSLNPSDIESIEILKDASATAIFGSRGSNGVILITTKSGSSGITKVDYNVSYGLQRVANPIELMNAEQYMEAIGGIFAEEGKTLPAVVSQYPGVDTDWQNELFQNKFIEDGNVALIQQHNLSFSGGSDNTRFFTSFNFTDQDGVVRSSGFQRYAGRVNLDHSAGKLDVKLNLSTSLVVDDIVPTGNAQNINAGVIHTVLNLSPTLPVFDDNGDFFFPGDFDLDNPYNIADGINIDGRTNRTFGNIKLDYNFLPELTASLNFGTDYENARKETYRSRRTMVGAEAGGVASVFTTERSNYLVEALLNYKKDFGSRNSFSALAGYTFQTFDSRNISANIKGFAADDLLYYNLGAGDDNLDAVGSGREKNTLLSFLGRVNYSHADKYLITASARIDGSSKFAATKKYGVFPSIAIGWRLSEETIIQSLGVFDDLKFRIGWGQIGNEQIPNFATIPTFSAGSPAIMGETYVLGLTPDRLPNRDLKWETTEQLNFGLDFGFVAGRITGSIDYFDKKTKDQLFQLPVPLQTGFATQWINLGETGNYGVEFALNTVNLTGTIGWETNFNFSIIRNRVTDLGGMLVPPTTADGASFTVEVGKPAFSYLGFEASGVWQENDDLDLMNQYGAQPGFPKWVDQNGDGTINSSDRVILGDSYPDYTFGINNTFNVGRFALNIFIEGVQGVDMYNFALAESYNPFNPLRNRLAMPLINRWTPNNPTNEWPSFSNVPSYRGDQINSFTIEDASFIRLKNVQLSYNFNTANIKFLGSFNAFVTATNIGIITDYSGFDPDVNSRGNSNLRIDRNSYPANRTIILGFNLGF